MTGNSETVFLLGAGFSHAISSSIPLNKNLLGKIIENGSSSLKKYQKQYDDTDDIEKLLTLLDLEAFEDEEKKRDRSEINKEIAGYFSNFRFSNLNGVLPPWTKTFALDILKKNDAIVNLNYDCSLEGILDNHEVWSPSNGYARIDNRFQFDDQGNSKNIKIYKIHGSENFTESSTMNSEGIHPTQTSIELIINESIYPRSGINRHFEPMFQKRPYIIAPSFIKIPHVDINAIMLEILDVAKTANNFVIIGCGMRPEDSFLRLLLTRFLNKNQDKRLILVDPNASKIKKKISDFWVGSIPADVQLLENGIENDIETLIRKLFLSPPPLQ